MKLRANDQLHISAVKADSLRPGEEFEVSDAMGEELLKAHPDRLSAAGGRKAAEAPANKAEGAAPENKAVTAPATADRTTATKRGRKARK